MEETGLVSHVGRVLDIVSDVNDLVREPVRLHSVRLIYDVKVEDGSPQPEVQGSTDAVRWIRDQDLEALPVMPWFMGLLIKHL